MPINPNTQRQEVQEFEVILSNVRSISKMKELDEKSSIVPHLPSVLEILSSISKREEWEEERNGGQGGRKGGKEGRKSVEQKTKGERNRV